MKSETCATIGDDMLASYKVSSHNCATLWHGGTFAHMEGLLMSPKAFFHTFSQSEVSNAIPLFSLRIGNATH